MPVSHDLYQDLHRYRPVTSSTKTCATSRSVAWRWSTWSSASWSESH